jgi:hypothetical protein
VGGHPILALAKPFGAPGAVTEISDQLTRFEAVWEGLEPHVQSGAEGGLARGDQSFRIRAGVKKVAGSKVDL